LGPIEDWVVDVGDIQPDAPQGELEWSPLATLR
jgi:hypothetical protein